MQCCQEAHCRSERPPGHPQAKAVEAEGLEGRRGFNTLDPAAKRHSNPASGTKGKRGAPQTPNPKGMNGWISEMGRGRPSPTAQTEPNRRQPHGETTVWGTTPPAHGNNNMSTDKGMGGKTHRRPGECGRQSHKQSPSSSIWVKTTRTNHASGTVRSAKQQTVPGTRVARQVAKEAPPASRTRVTSQAWLVKEMQEASPASRTRVVGQAWSMKEMPGCTRGSAHNTKRAPSEPRPGNHNGGPIQPGCTPQTPPSQSRHRAKADMLLIAVMRKKMPEQNSPCTPGRH